MNNKGTNFRDRIEITLMILNFVWFKKNVAMIDIMLSEKNEWVHHIIGSNLLTSNLKRIKEMVGAFKQSLENIFWHEMNK